MRIGRFNRRLNIRDKLLILNPYRGESTPIPTLGKYHGLKILMRKLQTASYVISKLVRNRIYIKT